MGKIRLDGQSLTVEDVMKVISESRPVELSEEGKKQVIQSREYVEKLIKEEKVVYGITTGFGKFSDTFIKQEDTGKLQHNLIVSHACGVGKPFSLEVVKAMMLLRANSLSGGYSGVHLDTLTLLIEMINRGVIPQVPSQGSLGASGDLVPLAHMALVLLGKGKAYLDGELLDGAVALNKVGLKPIQLRAKEGLALINGTQAMTSCGVLATYSTNQIKKLADVISAMTLEAYGGIIDAFDEKVGKIRKHQGQKESAKNIRNILKDSNLVTRQGELRVQDPYTLRCIAQVHGGSREAIRYVESVVSNEVNAVTDNPLIFCKENQVISGGNFHGQPMAIAMDTLAIAASELANISERRIERLVNPQLSGLPAFLTKRGGLNSGFMIPQYTAASLVSENKVLCHPASVDSIPSSANQEDHVSMGTTAARKALQVVENTYNVLAIELMSAVQALDFRDIEKMSKVTREVYDLVRSEVPMLEEDRELHKDMNKVSNLLKERILRRVEKNINLK
ncbi:histidine ammonia-lyase [Proteinivorax hydrogeniformans]|uniref:Histidine ammonia-lyase n=1 Tax=Proteinivorax hydrogeniformans TaxID=1826727 RepID=A0AAU8HTK7_9FIRM